MQVAIFSLNHYLALALMATCGYIFGRQLTGRLVYHSFWERLSFSLALGLGLMAYVVFFLGLLGWLYPAVVLTVLAAGALLCFRVWRDWPHALFKGWARLKGSTWTRRAAIFVPVAVALALLLPAMALPLYPPTQFDATMYHLPYAKIYAQQHAVVFTPNLRYVSSPQLNEMLFTLALLAYDDLLAQLTQFLMLAATAAATLAFGLRHFTPRAGWWAAALWLTNPLVFWLGTSAYVDIGLTFYVTMTIHAFWNWRAERETRWLALAGIFCGLAIGVKLLAFFFAGVLGLAVLYYGLRERRYLWPVIFGGLALAVAAPWLARNAYATGNPVYPLFHAALGKLIGGGILQMEYAQSAFDKIPYVAEEITLKAFWRLPWNLIFAQEIFPATAPLSVIYPCALPLMLVAAIFGARYRGLLILVTLYTPFWFFTIQELRYLIPILPTLGLAVVVAADHLLRRWPWRREWVSHSAVTALGCVLLLVPSYSYAMDRLTKEEPLPINSKQREEYYAQRLVSYPLYRRLNELKGKNYALYAAFDARMAYFADGQFMGDWFGPANYYRIHSPQTNPNSGERKAKLFDGPALYQTLKSFGADHFLVATFERQTIFPEDDFFRNHFKLIDARAYGLLFELTEQPHRPTPGPNLLRNAGFEEMENGQPKFWLAAGAPGIATTPEQSYSGRVAVNAIGADNVLNQRAAVTPGRVYALSYQARAKAPNQMARMQVNWADAQGAFLSADIEMVFPDANWKRYEMKVSAPPGAVAATVYASGHGASSIWFDEFVFSELNYEPTP